MLTLPQSGWSLVLGCKIRSFASPFLLSLSWWYLKNLRPTFNLFQLLYLGAVWRFSCGNMRRQFEIECALLPSKFFSPWQTVAPDWDCSLNFLFSPVSSFCPMYSNQEIISSWLMGQIPGPVISLVWWVTVFPRLKRPHANEYLTWPDSRTSLDFREILKLGQGSNSYAQRGKVCRKLVGSKNGYYED